ncbi:MAG: secE [Phycisphaerales bacterium]|nr:secE [Phycisphaerales bacterium]
MTKDNQDQADAADRDDETPIGGSSGAKPGPDKDDVRSLDNARATGPRGGGFFTIYKKGQGYWVRMGTLFGVGLVLFMLAYTLYAQVPSFFFGTDPAGQQTGKRVGIGLAVGFLVVVGLTALWLMNKPRNVEFLIATDSEMKKVNWTSRKELIGSSKVVILFMFFISAYLFLNDLIFGWLMYGIHVLKLPPPPFK